jgi:hypothetical protein
MQKIIYNDKIENKITEFKIDNIISGDRNLGALRLCHIFS